jgi:hypothetical protein
MAPTLIAAPRPPLRPRPTRPALRKRPVRPTEKAPPLRPEAGSLQRWLDLNA